MFQVSCNYCGDKVTFPDSALGQERQCPYCGQKILLGKQETSPSPSDQHNLSKPTIKMYFAKSMWAWLLEYWGVIVSILLLLVGVTYYLITGKLPEILLNNAAIAFWMVVLIGLPVGVVQYWKNRNIAKLDTIEKTRGRTAIPHQNLDENALLALPSVKADNGNERLGLAHLVTGKGKWFTIAGLALISMILILVIVWNPPPRIDGTNSVTYEVSYTKVRVSLSPSNQIRFDSAMKAITIHLEKDVPRPVISDRRVGESNQSLKARWEAAKAKEVNAGLRNTLAGKTANEIIEMGEILALTQEKSP